MRSLLSAASMFVVILSTVASVEAIDVVVRRSGAAREGGKLSKMTKTEVTITKQVGGDAVVPANDIAWIEHDNAPASVRLGRAALDAGQLDLALKQFEQAQTESAASDNAALRGDLEFSLAEVFARRALTDASQAAEAGRRLQEFLAKNRDHYRFYDAQLLLGDVSLAAGDSAAAVAAFTAAAAAPWKDYQMAAQIGQGRTFLAQQNVDAAQREFDAVAAVSPQTPTETSRRLQAMLGQARCLSLKGQHQPAISILEKVVDESSLVDTRLQAEAYLLQGDCLIAMGANPKEAIMAYLHIDVIPALAKETDFHAQALFHLARLWNQVGQPDRAREAADALLGQYPESEWAKKLGG
jgi:tetratricopeptide (TPR) repeat protein